MFFDGHGTVSDCILKALPLFLIQISIQINLIQ